MSICVQFELGPHLYRLVIVLSEFWDCTYIDRSSSCQLVFSLSWNCTYIDWSLSCQFRFELSRPYLYQSVIFLSVCVQFEFETAPILIDHFHISLCSVWVGITPISIGHRLVSFSFSFWDRTYIKWSSSYQFVFSLSWDRTYIDRLFIFLLVQLEFGTSPISIGHLSCQFVFSLSWDRTYIDRPSSCQFS